ncbi:chitinase 1 [Halteromyces radiatus]|uniref:chitinase 1 n=1 Tax=Halteromyces radiatus TaxID=101107 RepID=UPI00221EC96A|nr:chitinase 1 [Halteromyces radiatus]KAI8089417.1 chitinase 1 [Halteromyces radiatus]
MIFAGKRFISIVTATAALLASSSFGSVEASGIPSNAVVEYWGQNSAAAGGSGSQQNLAYYCDGQTDVLVISFLYEFNVGGLPGLNFANACTTSFDGTTLLHCPDIAKDIKTCQSKGVKILLSLGGAAGAYGFSSDAQATTFAQTLYDMFGAGTHKYRPFDDAQVDGFDFDIEGGGSTGYATLADTLKSLSNNQLLITGAPQCPFPDAMLGDALNNAFFDAVFVQFYNNYCTPSGSNFNFDTWNNWATTTSKNKNVKVFLGLPGSPTAAGSGYLTFSQIQSAVQSVQKYSSYAGVMFWDASQTYSNTQVSPNLATAVGKLVHGGASGSPSTTPTTGTTSTSSSNKQSSASATESSTSAVPSSSPTTSPSTCVKTGDSCPTNNQYTCSGSSFAACDNGKWVLQGCPSGLTCFKTTDGSSIYCAQPLSGKVDTCSASSASPASATAPKPYTNNRVQAQLSVVSSNTSSWSAVINARRTDIKPFGSQVVVGFTLGPHMNLTSADNAKISQKGNKVTMQVKNPHRKSMDLVFSIKGSIDQGGVFVAPSSSSMTFQS